jgi:hypothetical protein
MAKRRGYTLSIVGLGGVGKTDFLLKTCKRPLYVVASDPNTEAIADKYGLGKKQGVQVKHIQPPDLAFEDDRDNVSDVSQQKWEEFREALRPIVKGDRECATVGLDTANILYGYGILATFGKGDQIPPEQRRVMMGPINSRWRGIISSLEQRGINVVLLHHGAEMWEDVVTETQRGPSTERHKMSGVFDIERASGGFSGTMLIVQTEIVLGFNPNREGKLGEKFGMKIVRSQQRPGLIGAKYWGMATIGGERIRKASFPYLSTLLYPGTTLDDWR